MLWSGHFLSDLAAVSNLRIGKATKSSVQLSWHEHHGRRKDNKYEILLYKIGSQTGPKPYEAKESPFTLTGLQSGVTYKCEIYALVWNNKTRCRSKPEDITFSTGRNN